MTDFDQSIRESLSSEDAELFDRLGADQALHRQVVVPPVALGTAVCACVLLIAHIRVRSRPAWWPP